MSLALMAARPRHRPGGWTPKNLGTLNLWLDADDATTITIATGVSQWDDKSGNGRKVSQTTGANQPTLAVGATNGRAVLRFNGTSMSMSGGDVLDLGTSSLSAAGVYVRNGDNLGAVFGKWRADALNVNSGAYRAQEDVLLTLRQSGVSRTATATNPGAGTVLAAWVIDRSDGMTTYANGTAGTTAATGFPDSTSYNIGPSFVVGALQTGTTGRVQYLNGDIAEIVLSLVAWTTTERQYVEGYLAHKWGIVSSLPSDHPYKDKAP